jgi:TctA family transporter
MISKGSFLIFLTRPISLVFVIVALMVLMSPLVFKKRPGEGLQGEV